MLLYASYIIDPNITLWTLTKVSKDLTNFGFAIMTHSFESNAKDKPLYLQNKLSEGKQGQASLTKYGTRIIDTSCVSALIVKIRVPIIPPYKFASLQL